VDLRWWVKWNFNSLLEPFWALLEFLGPVATGSGGCFPLAIFRLSCLKMLGPLSLQEKGTGGGVRLVLRKAHGIHFAEAVGL
jgi:hypothetical protein